jgi:hypothetical protein
MEETLARCKDKAILTLNRFVASGIPAWQAECLKTHRRGTLLLVSFGSCLTFGIALAYWFVYAFSFTQPSEASWRVPIILACLFTLPALLIIVFMPEYAIFYPYTI